MPERILFVDDEAPILRCLERMFEDDYDVATAESGGAALELLRVAGPFRVIVTDMRMPGMDGVDFIKAAREIVDGVTFIMLTGNQDATTSNRAEHEAGVSRLLVKPCSGAELRHAIDQSMDRRAG